MTPMPKPSFDLGKSYRAVNRAVMKVTDMHVDGGFRARVTEGGEGAGGVTVVYDIRGVTLQAGWSDYNLYYGAVEDGLDAASRERKEMLDHLASPMSRIIALEKLAESIRLVADGAHIRCDVLTDRVAALEAFKRDIGKMLGETDPLTERVDGIQEHLLSIRDALMKDINAHTGRLNAIDDTLKTQDRAIGILDERVDNLEKHCEALQGNLDQLRASMVENFQLTDNRLAALETASVAYEGVTVAGKRVIKGGWINLFDGGVTSSLYADKWEAQAKGAGRIACIQIPDITEGDGL